MANPSCARGLRALLLAALVLAFGSAASARDPHALRSGSHGISSRDVYRHTGDTRPHTTKMRELRAYGDQKRLDARRAIRAQDSDVRLRSETLRLGPRPEPAAVERVRDRAHRRESIDALLNEADLATLERFHGPLGPTTRRVLERSRIRIDSAERQREIDVEADTRLHELRTEKAAERGLFEVSTP